MFPSRTLGLEIRGGFERLQGSWAHMVLCWVKDLTCFSLLDVMRFGILQWILWFGYIFKFIWGPGARLGHASWMAEAPPELSDGSRAGAKVSRDEHCAGSRLGFWEFQACCQDFIQSQHYTDGGQGQTCSGWRMN